MAHKSGSGSPTRYNPVPVMGKIEMDIIERERDMRHLMAKGA